MDGSIMIIDSSLTTRKILEVFLRRHDFEVVSFASSVAAFAMLRANPHYIPTFAFIATHLVEGDCLRAIRQLKKSSRFANTRILALLNSRQGWPDLLYARLTGAEVCMRKPLKTQLVHKHLPKHIQLVGME